MLIRTVISLISTIFYIYELLILANGAENSVELVRAAIKNIDQAAAKGIIHSNAAARKKSALACKLNKIG